MFEPVQRLSNPRSWDVFCHVVDNFGDVGVCWRLCADLSSRGHRVRLWIDDPGPLAWMAPSGNSGVQVLPWDATAQNDDLSPAEVVVEAFGCTLPDHFVRRMALQTNPPVWINLEYLSGEEYVERSHGLPSPQRVAADVWLKKWFFYPGLTPRTGGLLRERDLSTRQAHFDRNQWLNSLGLQRGPQERVISLFCYPNAPIAKLLAALEDRPTLILATPGAAQASLAHFSLPTHTRCHRMPWLSQVDFDHLLWSADLNFVRGEDSLGRALWAQVPFIWQIYEQDDGVHARKLAAFLQHMQAHLDRELAQAIQLAMNRWNGLNGDEAPLTLPPLAEWKHGLQGWNRELRRQSDLTSQLESFVAQQIDTAAMDENP